MPNSIKAPLRAAAATFATRVKKGDPTSGHTGAVVRRVGGPLKTAVVLLEHAGRNICLVASHLGTGADDASEAMQHAVAEAAGITPGEVVCISSHNHSGAMVMEQALTGFEEFKPKGDLTDLGKRFLRDLAGAARSLTKRLEPATVWHGQSHERTITYNRKGRRADGTTFLMREEDRELYGGDYTGDIDDHAPVVCLKNADGRPLAFLTHFNGHPVTTYHVEDFTVFGDWPQVAGDVLAKRCGPRRGGEAPVAFLQGCAGDVNSKHMFSGDIALATRYGKRLGAAYVRAAKSMRESSRGGFDFAVETAKVPLGPLPHAAELRRELAEMEDFVARAQAGDPDTLTCVGLNFSREMSPAYRGRLIELVMPWNRWALDLHARGKAGGIPKHFGIDVHVLRLGDVGIVGLACEPFLGLARQIRAGSPLPMTIPCGYTNAATGYIGYVPDAPNAGDREYMSAFHRYTRFLPPFRKPAGDVMAEVAIKHLRRFAGGGD